MPSASSADELLRRAFSLDGRVALVTGASSGLGAHLAATLARAGCSVALAARRRQRLETLAAAIATGAQPALPVVMDVTERASVEAAVAAVIERFGRIDVLLNNAGIAAPEKFTEMSERAWGEVVDTDLSAVWRVGQVVARQMVAQERGAIINVASMLGLTVRRTQANYSAAKAGVIQLTKTMALELGRSGVRVNALAPGYFATEMNRDFLASARGKEYIAGLLPQRAGQLVELDGALLLLAADAGSYINGSVISVDGGALLG